MNTKALAFPILVSLFIESCQTTTGPANSPLRPTSVTSLFLGKRGYISVQLSQPPPLGVYPNLFEQNEWLAPYCFLEAYYPDTLRTTLTIIVYPTHLTPGPITGSISIELGNNTILEPVTINVMDFYFASRLENNTDDTIKLRSGISFLLQLTCRDSADNIVSNYQVGRVLDGAIGGGHLVFPYSYYAYDAIFCESYYKDTTSYYYVFSTIPNVTFSPQDTGQYFQMQISNKVFNIPIRLVN
jgi:hypothetical protein